MSQDDPVVAGPPRGTRCLEAQQGRGTPRAADLETLARVAAVYNISIRELLTVSASLWDLCVMPSGELVASLREITRLTSGVIRQLTISACSTSRRAADCTQ